MILTFEMHFIRRYYRH